MKLMTTGVIHPIPHTRFHGMHRGMFTYELYYILIMTTNKIQSNSIKMSSKEPNKLCCYKWVFKRGAWL